MQAVQVEGAAVVLDSELRHSVDSRTGNGELTTTIRDSLAAVEDSAAIDYNQFAGVGQSGGTVKSRSGIPNIRTDYSIVKCIAAELYTDPEVRDIDWTGVYAPRIYLQPHRRTAGARSG